MVKMWFPKVKTNETTFFFFLAGENKIIKKKEVSQINAWFGTAHALLGKWLFWAFLVSSTVKQNASTITVSLTEIGPGFLSLFLNSSFAEIPNLTQVSQPTSRQDFTYTYLSGASCWELQSRHFISLI